MDSCKFTPFGLAVKTELLKSGKEQKWLEQSVTEKVDSLKKDRENAAFQIRRMEGEIEAFRFMVEHCHSK